MPKGEEDVNAAVVKEWIRDWAKPAAAALCVAVGLYYRIQWDLSEIKEHGMVNHARLIEETRAELQRKSHFGPDGFSDPGIALGLNAHIDRRTAGFYTRQEHAAWIRKLKQLNPQTVIPEE